MKKISMVLIMLLICITVAIGCATPAQTTAPATKAPAVPAQTTGILQPMATTAPAAKAPVTSAPAKTIEASKETTPRYGGTLRMVEASGPGQPFGYPPLSSGGGNQYIGESQIKELEGGSFVPCLSTSWDVDTDPKNPSITFHLRKGVKFQDGTDFNAQAFKWLLIKMGEGGMNRSNTNTWKSFDTPDDYTLRINLTEWRNAALRGFSGGMVFAISPAAFEKNDLEWTKWHMVGTGAFKQVDFKRDVSMTLTRNDNYWDAGKPYLLGMKIDYVVDELTRIALFKSGGADILNLGGSSRVASELKAAGFEIVTQYGYGPTVLMPDSGNADSPWSNIKVREAAEYAIDKEALAKAFGYGYWQASYQINRPGNIAYDKSITGRKYDPAKAKQLLTEAGYPNGFKTKIYAGASSNRDVVVAIQSNLAQVGIQVDLDFPETAKFTQYMLGDYKNGLVYTGLAGWANPNVLFGSYFGTPPNFFKNIVKPEGWAELLKQSNNTALAEAELTQKLERMLYENALGIPLYHSASMYALTDKVHDTGIGTRGMTVWWEPQNTWLSP